MLSIFGYEGKVERVWQPTFLDELGLPSIGIGYAYEGAPMGSGTTHRVYLFWLAERGEWLLIRSSSDYEFPKRGEDVTYFGLSSLNDFHIAKLLEAYGVKPDSIGSEDVPRTSPSRLDELANAGDQ